MKVSCIVFIIQLGIWQQMLMHKMSMYYISFSNYEYVLIWKTGVATILDRNSLRFLPYNCDVSPVGIIKLVVWDFHSFGGECRYSVCSNNKTPDKEFVYNHHNMEMERVVCMIFARGKVIHLSRYSTRDKSRKIHKLSAPMNYPLPFRQLSSSWLAHHCVSLYIPTNNTPCYLCRGFLFVLYLVCVS